MGVAAEVIDVDREETSTELVVRPTGVVMPVAGAQQLVEAMRAYEETRAALMTPRDFQRTRNGDFPKKSYFTKLSIAYGASVRVKEGYPKLTYDETGTLVFAECVCIAEVPSGRVTEGWDACSINEPRYTHHDDDTKNGNRPRWKKGDPIPAARQKLEHDLPATAETRATNRALSKMFGYSGEVSWEEVNAGVDEPPRAGATNASSDRSTPAPQRQSAPASEWRQQFVRDVTAAMRQDRDLADQIRTWTDEQFHNKMVSSLDEQQLRRLQQQFFADETDAGEPGPDITDAEFTSDDRSVEIDEI